jgi:hypothetical protein
MDENLEILERKGWPGAGFDSSILVQSASFAARFPVETESLRRID